MAGSGRVDRKKRDVLIGCKANEIKDKAYCFLLYYGCYILLRGDKGP